MTQLTSIDQKLALISSKIAPGLGNTGSEQAFISGCIVFFSVCGFLESFLWTRINMANVLKHADLEEFINQVQGQGDKDARALSLVNSILNPSLDMPPVTDAELIPAIQDASPSVKVQIFYLAQDMRSQHWQKNKAIMERTIPVFRGLIASDPQDLYHRNHGQLGYALKDKRVPDFQQAEAELTKAIEIRDKNGISGWQYYEWNRALCRIAMDKNFLAGQNSSGEYRELILKDLRVAAESELRSKISVPEIIKWCTVNNIDPQKLA